MPNFEEMRERLFQDGFVVWHDAIPRRLGHAMANMVGDAPDLAKTGQYKFKQRWALRNYRDRDIGPLIEFRRDDWPQQLMGTKGWWDPRYAEVPENVPKDEEPWWTCGSMTTASVLVTVMTFGCRFHRDRYEHSKPHHPIDTHIAAWSNPNCDWQINLNLSRDEDDCLWVVPGSHKWVHFGDEKRRAQRPRFWPEPDVPMDYDRLVRLFEDECGQFADSRQIVLPPYGMVVMNNKLLHAGGLYRLPGQPFRGRVMKHGRLTFHDFLDNAEHELFRMNLDAKAEERGNRDLRWWDLADEVLAEKSIPYRLGA